MENQQKTGIQQLQPKVLCERLLQTLLKQSSLLEFKELAFGLVKNGCPDFSLILSDGTQMSILKKDKGIHFLGSVMIMLITDFQKSFNLIRPMDNEQVANLSMELINDYWSYRFEDFVAFFQLAKKGVYGKILDRMDANTIQSMLLVYDTQRVDELRASQARLQESKANLNEFAKADRNEQNRGFTDHAPQIGDFIKRLKDIENK
jgi:hypothetical protein